MNENPPPPPNNDNDNDDADDAAAAIIPVVEDGRDDDDDEDEDDEVGIDSEEEEDNNAEVNFGPPVLPEDHHSDDENNEDDDDDEDVDDDQDAADADVDDDFIDDPVEQERICQEATAILLNRLNFPSPQRDRSIVRFAQQFITNVKEDIHKTLTDMRLVDEGYNGLDSERDTEAEVETAIRCDPDVLTRRDDRFGLYPIYCLTFMLSNDGNGVKNAKAVSFVPLFAKLAIEFNSFEEHERGGLLIAADDGCNVLHDLMYSSDPSFDEEHHERVDTSFLAVLIRLRQSSYFVHEDIQQHQLVHELCKQPIFPNQRFRFLTEIDPASLLQTDENGYLPLHWAGLRIQMKDAIQNFRPVCDAVFRYYPKWKGIQLLHQKDTRISHGSTPFRLASDSFGHTAVRTIVEETLARYSETVLPDIPKALILAASEERIHVECVYFLLKRQPDITISTLQQHYDRPLGSVLSSSSSSSSTNSSSRRRTSRNTNNRIVRRSTRKRKRN